MEFENCMLCKPARLKSDHLEIKVDKLFSQSIKYLFRTHKLSVCLVFRNVVFFQVASIPLGEGGTPIYKLYGYVPLRRVWFSFNLFWDRV